MQGYTIWPVQITAVSRYLRMKKVSGLLLMIVYKLTVFISIISYVHFRDYMFVLQSGYNLDIGVTLKKTWWQQ